MRPLVVGWVPAVFGATAVCLSGCCLNRIESGGSGSGSGGGSGNSILTASSSNSTPVSTAVQKAEQMLAQGSDPNAIASALATQLSADSRVAGAGVDTDGEVVWADFIDGEIHCFLFIDESKDSAGTLKEAHERWSATEQMPEPLGLPGKTSGLQQPAVQGMVYTLPGSNKALLANALDFVHGDWSFADSTGDVQKMLEARGYTVTRHDLVLDDFSQLSDYGVIFLESHGTWRKPQYPPEMLQLPPELGVPGTGTCGGAGSKMTVLTTTQVTADNLKTYYQDLICGRVTIWNVTIVHKDKTTTRRQYFGVTPNYVREYDKGKFAENTLFLLSACRGYADDLSSPFADLLYEKCDRGACFVGWTGKVLYARSARAALYLFQLMTASNEEKIVDSVTVLKKFSPPQGGNFTGLNMAWAEMHKQLYTTDLASGALLQPMVQNNAAVMPMLVPHPLSWEVQSGGDVWLRMFSDSQPTVTIGGTSVTATSVTNWSGVWKLSSVPVGAYGDILVSRGGVTSIARPLRRWRPSIKVTGNQNGLQYTVTFTLQARATIDGNSFRTSVWSDAPTATFFDTDWDKQACIVAWNVTGQRTTADYSYSYSGSGSQAFGANDGGWIKCASDGKSAELSVYGEIAYTTTTTNLKTSAVSTSNDTQKISVSRSGVGLSDNWTVSSASFQQNVGFGGNAQVSWSAFTSSPPFNKDSEPR